MAKKTTQLKRLSRFTYDDSHKNWFFKRALEDFISSDDILNVDFHDAFYR